MSFGKLFLAMLVLFVMSVFNVMALDNIDPPAGGGFYDGKVNETARTALHTTITAEMTAQADTNVTTTATAYTPRRAGDVLVGGAGAGTNGVWISKGTSTNDWVQVKP